MSTVSPVILHFEESGEWHSLPAWAEYVISVGKQLSTAENATSRIVTAIVVPTRAYCAAFVSLGMVISDAAVDDPSSTAAHFEKLFDLPAGTPVILRQGGRKVLRGVLQGPEEIDHKLYVRVQVQSRDARTGGGLPTALWLLRSRFWPVPVTPPADSDSDPGGKSPIGRGWGVFRPTAESLRGVFTRHPRAGVGVALGPAGGVIDVEVDDPEGAAAEFARLDLPPTLGWRSARGEHRLFGWDPRLKMETDRAGGAIEIRIGGDGKQLFSVCPPTVGSDRRCREWNGVWEVAKFPERLLERLTRSVHVGRIQRESLAPLEPNANRYAVAAVRAEAALVRTAAVGTRTARSTGRRSTSVNWWRPGWCHARWWSSSSRPRRLTRDFMSGRLPRRSAAASTPA